jgi:hypothetical protein
MNCSPPQELKFGASIEVPLPLSVFNALSSRIVFSLLGAIVYVHQCRAK